ncbi:NUDIX domain-containing protein [Glycomyces salinus]|uniref:NUDIX domain-containing protein n=1 Tax=Glycomyces salinus TaxID=980294 RepID=UPI0018EBB107|nr:NUDIX domain-containing protein [Glycomyces salinus]
MYFVELPRPVLRSVAWAQRRWWRLRRPTTFGVKAFLRLPDGRFLVVRHAYGDTARWGLPGGGYRPGRESPAEAAAREVREELGLAIDPVGFEVLDRALTTAEGKRDTVTILTAQAPSHEIRLAAELAEARWIAGVDELDAAPVSRRLKMALALTGRR